LPKSLIQKRFFDKSTISVDISVSNLSKAHAKACQHWVRAGLRGSEAVTGVLQIKHLAHFRGSSVVQKQVSHGPSPRARRWG
jgi:hypothetical protein